MASEYQDENESTPGPFVYFVIACLVFALLVDHYTPSNAQVRQVANNSEFPNSCYASVKHSPKLFMLKPIASATCWHIVEASTVAEALEMSDATPGSVEAIEIYDGLNSSMFACECR